MSIIVNVGQRGELYFVIFRALTFIYSHLMYSSGIKELFLVIKSGVFVHLSFNDRGTDDRFYVH